MHAVELMRATVGGSLGIKASGGIRSYESVQHLAAAGATRFGVSGTGTILQEWPKNQR